MTVSQKSIRKAVSGLLTFKIHYNQTPVQCFSMSPRILACIKREKSLMPPEKCNKVSNFIPHLISHQALFSHLVSDFLS